MAKSVFGASSPGMIRLYQVIDGLWHANADIAADSDSSRAQVCLTGNHGMFPDMKKEDASLAGTTENLKFRKTDYTISRLSGVLAGGEPRYAPGENICLLVCSKEPWPRCSKEL